MDSNKGPLSYGVRGAIRDSGLPPYRFDKLPKVSARNLYRFLNGSRGLAQETIDEIGKFLKLSVTLDHSPLRPSHLKPYRRVMGLGTAGDLDRRINDPPDSTLSERIRRAAEMHESTVAEIAGVLKATGTQLYRFLDGSRGLSQAKLDKLCALLGLFVEAPPEVVYPRRSGAMVTSKRRIYIPTPLVQESDVGESDGRQGPTARPPTLYVPPADEPDAQS